MKKKVLFALIALFSFVSAWADGNVAKIGDTEYATLEAAFEAAPEGGTIQLIGDVTLAYPGNGISITNGKSYVVDLNNHSISYQTSGTNSSPIWTKGVFVVTNGSLALTGTGTVHDTGVNAYAAVILSGSDDPTASNFSVLTVGENVTLTSDYCGIMVTKTENNHAYGVVVNFNGTIESPVLDATGQTEGFGVYLNGSVADETGNVPVFNINGTIESEGTGIYAAGYAKWTVNSTIESQKQCGIEIRAGEMAITDGTYTALATPTASGPNGNGTTTEGAAVAVVQHSTVKPIDLDITGGTFNCAEGGVTLFVSNSQKTSFAGVDVSVAGGTFTGQVFVNDLLGNEYAVPTTFNKKFITGGTFAGTIADVAESAEQFLANGATIDQTTGVVGKTNISTGFGVNIVEKSYEYNGLPQKPEKIEVGKLPEGTTATSGLYNFEGEPLKEGVDYKIEWKTTNFTNAGQKKFDIVGMGGYEGTIADEFYTITGKKLNVNVAQLSKTYGTADPTYAKVEQDASTLMVGGEDFDDIRKAFLFERETDEGETKENVGPHRYIVHVDPSFPLNYDVSILQNYGYLYIEKADLTIEATPASRMFNEAEPTAFNYVVNDALKAQLPEWDKSKAKGTPGAEGDIIATITRAPGNTIGKYDFTATAANYNVIVSNQFEIKPATDISGLNIAFKNGPFTYKAAKWEPAIEVTDKNGTIKLAADEDYVITAYGDDDHDNLNAGTNAGSVTIELRGAYASLPPKTVTGEFDIQKADLVLQAKSYGAVKDEPFTEFVEAAEPTKWFKGEETILTETTRVYGEEPNENPYLTLPTITKVATSETGVYTLRVNNDGEARNYNIIPRNGIYAPGYTPVVVVPNDQTQIYGDDEITPLTVKASVNEDELDDISFLFIGGKPVYKIAREKAGTTEGRNVGKYDITLSGPTVLKGYAVEYNDNVDGYEIVRRPLTIKANDKSKTYGSADPTFDATVKPGETAVGGDIVIGGLVFDDTAASIGLVHDANDGYNVGCGTWNNWARRWDHGEDVGTYDITVRLRRADGNYGNYHVVTEKGTLTINQRVLTIKADDKTKAYGAADPELTATVKDGDNIVEQTQEIRGLYTLAIGKNAANKSGSGTAAEPGTYPIEITLVGSAQELPRSNYVLTTENGTLTISKAKVVVKAKDQWIDYGGNIDEHNVIIYAYDPEKEAYTENDIIMQWTSTTSEGLDEEAAKVNAKIAGMVTLSVLDGKKHVGANEDAYDYTFTTNDFYEDVKSAFINGYLTVYPLEYIPLEQADLIALTGDKNIVLKKVLEDHKGLTVDVTLPARKMDADEWYTWVLPFEVKKPSDLFREAVWGYGALETLDVSKSKGDIVSFALQVTNSVPANTPFIVKIENPIAKEDMKKIRFYNVTIDDALDYVNARPTAGAAPNVQFVGLYEETEEGFFNNKKLMYNAKAGGHDHREFWPGGPGLGAQVVLSRTNAYLEFQTEQAAANARIFIQEEDGTLTEITGVEAGAEVTYGEGWYTITGVKLTAEPTVSGTYIYNGKKVFFQAK